MLEHRVREARDRVYGVVVRSRGVAGNVTVGLRRIFGGVIREYTELLEEAQRHSIDRMVENATAMGANAVVMMRSDSSEIGQSMAVVVAYGTAAILEE